MASTRATPLSLSSLLFLLIALPTSYAIHLPGIPARDGNNLKFRAAPHPVITPAPSVDALEQRLGLGARAATVASCAEKCIASVVTKSTSCQLDDSACMCAVNNAYIIQFGAAVCVQSACGYFVAESIWSSAAQVCTSIRDGVYTPDTTGKKTTATDNTGKNTQPAQTTAAGAPAGGASSSSGNGDSSNSGSSSDSLSKGAIAGIAVGAAAGAIILCAIIFFIYRCTKRKQNQAYQPPQQVTGNVGGQQPPMSQPPVAALAAVPGNKPELDGKSGVYTMSGASPAPTPSPAPLSADTNGVSRNPSTVSAPSPAPPAPGQVPSYYPNTVPELGTWDQQQQQQQQYQHQQSYQQQGYVHPGAGGVYHEVQGARPEMAGDTQIRQELHGQPYGTGVYEMPGSHVR